MAEEIKIDVFDQAAAEKKYDEIESKSNKDVSFSKSDVAKKMGVKEEDLNIPGTDSTPCVKVIKNIQNTELRDQVKNAMSELRAEQLTGGNGGYSSLTPDQKTQVDIEMGKTNKDKYVNNEKKDWFYNATHIKKRDGSSDVNPDARVVGFCKEGNTDNSGLGHDAKCLDSMDEQNEVTCFGTTNNDDGIFCNGNTKKEGQSMSLCYHGKQSAMRMNKEGVHMSTSQAMNLIIGSYESVRVNGQSAKHVAGGYNLIIDGPINIYAKDDITISTDGDMNFTSKGNINFQCDGNFNVFAQGIVAIKSTGETALNADGKLSIATKDELHLKSDGTCLFGGKGSVGMKGGGNVNINGATVNINGSGSQDAAPTTIPVFNIPAAAPSEPNVVDV